MFEKEEERYLNNAQIVSRLKQDYTRYVEMFRDENELQPMREYARIIYDYIGGILEEGGIQLDLSAFTDPTAQ